MSYYSYYPFVLKCCLEKGNSEPSNSNKSIMFNNIQQLLGLFYKTLAACKFNQKNEDNNKQSLKLDK